MQAQRTFLLVLCALILGFALGWWISERHKKTVTVAEADYLLSFSGHPTLAAIAGNVITWRRQDNAIDQFSVTVPDGLCPSGSQFRENDDGQTMTATASGDEIIKCVVIEQQSGTSPTTYPFDYTTNLPKTPPYKPLYIGSCQGCGSATGSTGLRGGVLAKLPDKPGTRPILSTQTQPPYYITCSKDAHGDYHASVAPIVIPSTQQVNEWQASGKNAGWYVKFPDPNPCQGNSEFDGLTPCYLVDNPNLNQPYNYTAHLNQCPVGGPASEAPGSFTVTPPTVQ